MKEGSCQRRPGPPAQEVKGSQRTGGGHLSTPTFDPPGINRTPARAVIVSNQLQVVTQLSLSNRVLTCARCHLITCVFSLLTSHSELAGSFSLPFGGLTWGPRGLCPVVRGSWGPGEVDE